MNNSLPNLGFGLGLRPNHYEDILQSKPNIDFLEIITENYLVPGGKPIEYLEKIRAQYPMVMHGVSLSLGSTDPLNWDYLKEVKQLTERVQPEWLSDHLCWTGVDGINLHDLLPLPYTEEAINHVAERIIQVQEFLNRRILIENVSSYLTFSQSQMSEWEFLSAIVTKADCLILLDVNNVYVSAFNHGFNPQIYLENIPSKRVTQIHLAGHSKQEDIIIDTHDNHVVDEVWDLYAQALKLYGPVTTMIERDDNIPPLAELLLELDKARHLAAQFENAYA